MCEIAAGQEAGAMSPGGWTRGRETDRVSGGGERAQQSQLQGLGRKAPEGNQRDKTRAQERCQAVPEKAPRVPAHGQHGGPHTPRSGPFYLQTGVGLSQGLLGPSQQLKEKHERLGENRQVSKGRERSNCFCTASQLPCPLVTFLP